MVRMRKGCQTGTETGVTQYCHGAWLWNGERQAMARTQWGSGLDGAWRLDRLRQAAATRTMAPETASAWRCRLSRQAVVANFVSLRRLAPGGTCPPPDGLEAGSAWRHVSPARRFALLQL